jgi:N6-adenosine-specific RNA methylase IME4
VSPEALGESILVLIPIDRLRAHPQNPRLGYRQDVLDGIVAGLNGAMAPQHALLVRPVENGLYEILSGHHRWQAGLKKGLKVLPCWVEEMSDEEALMILATDNNQGELTGVEKAIHCFTVVGKIEPATRNRKLANYAKETGWKGNHPTEFNWAGEVILTTTDTQQRCCLSKVAYLSFTAIHDLDPSLWQAFVEALLADVARERLKDWSVSETQEKVRLARQYWNEPIKDHAFLPQGPCAVAVGLGEKTVNDFLRLAQLEIKVRDELAGTSENLASEWIAWLIENTGQDSWDLRKVQNKRLEFEERAVILAGEIAIANRLEPPEIVLADPPWRYDFAETDCRQIENQYPTMTVEDIEAMVPATAENCVLLLWATAPKLQEAMRVMEVWGFTYKTHAIWDKEKIGMGYWFRGQHELILVGTKGQCSPPEPADRVSSVFRGEPRAGHSVKPEDVYQFIERAFAGKSKLEMFAREERAGWQSMGNEA